MENDNKRETGVGGRAGGRVGGRAAEGMRGGDVCVPPWRCAVGSPVRGVQGGSDLFRECSTRAAYPASAAHVLGGAVKAVDLLEVDAFVGATEDDARRRERGKEEEEEEEEGKCK